MTKVILFSVLVIIGAFMVIMLANTNKNTNNNQQLTGITPFPTRTQPKPTAPVISVSPTESGSPTASPKTSPTKDTEKAATQAAILTTKGEIVINLYRTDAPNTVKNFESKSKSGFYKSLTFHRVEDWVIQGGDPKGNGTGGGEMKTEINKKPFTVGSVGVARGGNKAISNDSQFFITKKDASWLNEEYTNFGMVKEGMDVVEKIAIGDKILDITLR